MIYYIAYRISIYYLTYTLNPENDVISKGNEVTRILHYNASKLYIAIVSLRYFILLILAIIIGHSSKQKNEYSIMEGNVW